MEFQTDTGVLIGQNEDLTQILPIQQKRTIAFINGFIMQTVSLLNKFAQSCESQFMELEYRMQKIEASLLILESQLSSIEGLNNVISSVSTKTVDDSANSKSSNVTNSVEQDVEVLENTMALPDLETKADNSKIKIGIIYQKFFKMVQVGVPVEGVKLKMQSEGLDPNILDTNGDIEFVSNDES